MCGVSTLTSVPFLNLKKQYLSIRSEIDQAIHDVLETCNYVKGKDVAAFAKGFSEYLGAGYCIGVGNGTDALEIALKALNVGPGDEVITVPNTFIATVEAIIAVGAVPVLVDIDYDTYTLDPVHLEAAINDKTAAIIPVHLYGMPCDMDAINEIAVKKGIPIVCDAAQAHGTRYRGKHVSCYGSISTYSFYPGKNLGACGDAGAVVTDDPGLATRIRMLADHGRQDKYLHQVIGSNSRLDSLQAAILNIKLQYLETWNDRRKEIVKLYNQGLADIDNVTLPLVPEYAEPCWHQYVIRADTRDELKNYLSKRGVETGIHYPVPIPEQPALKNAVVRCDRARLVTMCNQILSLPVCPEMDDSMAHYVVDSIHDYFKCRMEQ